MTETSVPSPHVSGLSVASHGSSVVAVEHEKPAASVTTNRGYGDVVQDHFTNPRNVGYFDVDDSRVGSALLGAIDQGAVISMQIRVDESGIINDTCFKAYGCGATIAAASWVTEWAKGKTPDQARNLRSTEVVRALSLTPVKTHCAILAENAIKAAVDNYTQRQE